MSKLKNKIHKKGLHRLFSSTGIALISKDVPSLRILWRISLVILFLIFNFAAESIVKFKISEVCIEDVLFSTFS